MAKKVVAGFKEKGVGKEYVKLITMVKGRSGGWKFLEKIVRKDEIIK